MTISATDNNRLNAVKTLLLITVFFFSSLFFLAGCYSPTVVEKTVAAKPEAQQHLISKKPRISEKILSNGLKVIVKPDHRAPVVISQVWYKVGASYESGGTTGVSHVLEHMMFKGTKKYPSGEFNKILFR